MASMAATFTNFLAKQTPYLSPVSKTTLQFSTNHLPTKDHLMCKLQTGRSVKSAAAATGVEKVSRDERVQKVHSMAEFDEALRKAKNRLVVVEYAASDSENSNQIYPFMVELSRSCSDVDFLLVMGDESEATRALCAREKIEQVPHFSFYKSMEKIHEEEAIGPDQLVGDVLYYGDSHSAVVQLHSREDVEMLDILDIIRCVVNVHLDSCELNPPLEVSTCMSIRCRNNSQCMFQSSTARKSPIETIVLSRCFTSKSF